MLHDSIKEKLITCFAKAVEELHGIDIHQSEHYVRIVNQASFNRIEAYLKDGEIRYGGKTIDAERFIEPTLLDNVSVDSPVMQEEIFGPLFPIITFKNIYEVVHFVTESEKPLALYYFCSASKAKEVFRRTSSGGACINDVIMLIANDNVPFRGVGNSGLGCYHGKVSFLTFSH